MRAALLIPSNWPSWMGLGCLRLLERLPYPAMLVMGRLIGRLARRLPLHYVRVARRNIELCLPELSHDEREQLLDRHFDSLGIAVCESAMCWWSSDERIRTLSQIEGFEHL